MKPVNCGCGVHTVPVAGAVSGVTGAVLENHTPGIPVKYPTTDALVEQINGFMHRCSRDEVKLSAARYNKKGNLILTAHHATTKSQLNSMADPTTKFIVKLADTVGRPVTHPVTPRGNVKWSKILINSVPIGAGKNGPYTIEECHISLLAHNPSYAALKITQKPSWIRPPSTLITGKTSSLVFAFEDPDGSVKHSLLSNKQLYILRTRAKVTRWKDSKRTPHPTKQPAQLTNPPSDSPPHSEEEKDSNMLEQDGPQ
jgi:hypothetical protein